MKRAIILHGTLGSPDGNWFRWLEAELSKLGFEVWLPKLPQADSPRLSLWADFVKANCPFVIDDQTLIVGHSSGAILALILVQVSKTQLGAVVAVSVFHDNSLKWAANNNLFDVSFDWPAIRHGASKLVFVHSDDDPYVPLEQAKFVANNCRAVIVVLPGEGHFNLEQSPDYEAFPKLLELMRQKRII